MKQRFALSIGAFLVLLVIGGCARPRLTSRPMSPEEFSWSLILRQNYPAWNAPYFSPMTEEGKSGPISLGINNAVPVPSPIPLRRPATLTDDVEFVPVLTE